MLRAAILHECQNYLGDGGGLGESEKNIPDARPFGAFENQDTNDGKTVRRGISKRSHEKIGDCEQSK